MSDVEPPPARTWPIPDLPADATAVSDSLGLTWRRILDGHAPTLGYVPLWCHVDANLRHVHLPTQDLLGRGPLREVSDAD